MKKIWVIFLGVFMITAFCSFLGYLFGNSISPKRKIAYKICNDLSSKFKKKYNLEFLGISEEAADGKYKCIGIELEYNKKILSKDEGRILLLGCAHDALEAFNNRAEFKQYMENYPFTGNNIIINIYVHPLPQYNVSYPDITVLSFYNDILSYKTKTPQKRFEYFTEEEETIEEALKIVKAQQRADNHS